MKKKLLLTVFVFTLTLSALAKNTTTSVDQVTSSIIVNGETDYIIKGKTPFAGNGLVNITGTEHAVLILQEVKPSVAISTLLSTRVRINSSVAHNGVNCQVRLYGTRGCMILPYASTDKPLTVYSEQHFGGESCNDFGLENDGGYMVTLTDLKLNNRIRSFRLKRGYMVTFATQRSGYGYQRCFIANDQDVEMGELPQILDRKISSYRIFKWNTAGKKGLASNTDASVVAAVGAISCYDWGVGHDMQPDVECVPHHLYEDWPSSAECGRATWSCHMKTNNEPRNSADDKPQSLSTILGNWQNLMRTGMRLCSPSSWDGSDYTDGSGFLKEFFDAIDARGWRCDIADLHCYWTIDNFNNLGAMHNKYKRPIWISEWIWGASWNHNGAFESGKTDGDIAWGVEQICNKLNSYGYVERYFYWNSESKGKLYQNGGLTQTGKYYANMLTGMGYNSSYEKIPNLPPMQGGFSNFKIDYSNGQATISWHDYDGEYNQLMEVLRKEPGGAWHTWQIIRPEDAEADYSIVDYQSSEDTRYRLHIKSFGGTDYYSPYEAEVGDVVDTEGGERYMGGNLIPNGRFDMGLFGWTSGTGQPLGHPWFEVFPKEDGGNFLQAFANHGKDGEGALKTGFDIEPNQDYVCIVTSKDAGGYLKVETRAKGATNDENKLTFISSSLWNTNQGIFNSGQHNEALLAFRWLAGTAQISNIELRRLCHSQEEAVADAVACARKQAQTFMQWNTAMPALNNELEQRIAALTAADQSALEAINLAIDEALQAVADKQAVDSLLHVAKAIDQLTFDGQEALIEAEEAATAASESIMPSAALASARQQLQQAIDNFLTMSVASTQPQSPDFSQTDGWLTHTGTYTAGDQRTATQEDKTCWNAWWAGINASEGNKQTMEIRQQLSNLPEGLYALQCKATTQHYCLSDQHGFIATSSENAVTPHLTRDYLDVPGTIGSWETLTTTPIYVSANDVLTIGFTGSKQGAIDNAWRRYGTDDTANNTGDKREGWWCATDFQLLYHPAFRFDMSGRQWGTVCLPYQYHIPQGAKLYRLAGLLSDYSRVCLEEVTETEVGHPYIYFTESPQVTFCIEGEPASSPVNTTTNYLTGYFQADGDVPYGRYVLKDDGEWYRVTEEYRPAAVSYSAVIRRAEGLPVMDSWNGATMIIHGVDDELAIPTAISTMQHEKEADGYYTIGGRKSNRKPAGPHIQVEGKQARKVAGK